MNIQSLKSTITHQHHRESFSGVIFLRQQGQVVFAEGFGMANIADQLPNTADTRFGTASGAKTFTAVAICQLVEAGKLSFDTPLKDCLDIPLPHVDPGVTVHHLLTHSAGIPDYFDEGVMDDYEVLWRERPMYAFRSPRDFLPLFANSAMQFKPGDHWAYNNAGFIQLGLVVEHMSGLPFTQYIEEHIFKPCGMTCSGYFALDRLPKGTALGYLPTKDGGWRSNIYSIPIIGGADGGAFTTVNDLARFWDALLGYRLLNKETTERMLTPYWRTNPDNDRSCYGYGIWIKLENGERQIYSMQGEDPGVSFYPAYYPKPKLQFSLLGNTVEATDAMYHCIAPFLRDA